MLELLTIKQQKTVINFGHETTEYSDKFHGFYLCDWLTVNWPNSKHMLKHNTMIIKVDKSGGKECFWLCVLLLLIIRSRR